MLLRIKLGTIGQQDVVPVPPATFSFIVQARSKLVVDLSLASELALQRPRDTVNVSSRVTVDQHLAVQQEPIVVVGQLCYVVHTSTPSKVVLWPCVNVASSFEIASLGT